MALLHLPRLVADDMIKVRHGVIPATDNSSAYRGKAGFAGFAPTKAAQRILLASIARAVGHIAGMGQRVKCHRSPVPCQGPFFLH